MKKEIENLINKANRYLKSAELLLSDGDYDSCVSRCYYAMFYLTEAVLLAKGLRAHSHKGVMILFGEHFIKPGIFKDDLGKALRRAYDLRQKGDYEALFTITEEEAKKYLEIAKKFVKELSEYLEEAIE